MRIHFGQPPYDDSSIDQAKSEGGCGGVGHHFEQHPINPGDCTVIDGDAYRITAVRVMCDGNPVYERGAPSGDPDHTETYVTAGVTVQLWLEPIPLEECP